MRNEESISSKLIENLRKTMPATRLIPTVEYGNILLKRAVEWNDSDYTTDPLVAPIPSGIADTTPTPLFEEVKVTLGF